MDWNMLVDEFRSLGGIAENVRLDTGTLGRGIFAVDPAKPARLHASENLLFPLQHLELDGERLRVKPGALGARESAFFDAYQEHFGWSAGGYAHEQELQAQWHALPSDLIHAIAMLGALPKEEPRFGPPSLDVCMYYYILSRQFEHRGTPCLIPMIDLVNHSSSAPSYVYENGVGVAARADGELRVTYNIADAWALAMVYGFTDQTDHAYSLGITVGLYGTHELTVFRNSAAFDIHNGIAIPETSVSGNRIELTNMMLGSRSLPATPRTAFRKTMQPWLATARADETFESIQRFNRTRFIELLRITRAHHGPLVDTLEIAALNQLEALAACVGVIAGD